MKTLLVIPITIAAVFGIAATALVIAGFSVKPADPLLAGAIGSAAGILGILPALRSRGKDPVAAIQSALAGTVLHLLTQAILAIAIIASHSVQSHAFPYWLLGGYWTSLVVLIWQLRRIILGIANVAKVTHIDS
jgi:hypothetical protein